MTLGDDPDLITVTGLATVIEGDTLQVSIHSVPFLETAYLSFRLLYCGPVSSKVMLGSLEA